MLNRASIGAYTACGWCCDLTVDQRSNIRGGISRGCPRVECFIYILVQ